MSTIFENFLNYLKTYYLEILNIVLTIVLLILVIISFNQDYPIKQNDNKVELNVNENIQEKNNSNFVRVDIKGAVKKPGVYSLNDNSIINDVIKEAGGLKNNASTENINLSKQIKDEMVIYISTKNQLKKNNNNFLEKNVNESNSLAKDTIVDINSEESKGTGVENIPSLRENIEIKDNKENTFKLININTCTKEELLTLNGIGESKADKIIEYRTLNGLFKTIEDIKNVSGIGETAFEKIKDFITI